MHAGSSRATSYGKSPRPATDPAPRGQGPRADAASVPAPGRRRARRATDADPRSGPMDGRDAALVHVGFHGAAMRRSDGIAEHSTASPTLKTVTPAPPAAPPLNRD